MSQKGRLLLRRDYVLLTSMFKQNIAACKMTCMFDLLYLCTCTAGLPGYSHCPFFWIPHPKKNALGEKIPSSPELFNSLLFLSLCGAKEEKFQFF